MSQLTDIFNKIEILTLKDGVSQFLEIFKSNENDSFNRLKQFLGSIIQCIDDLASEIRKDRSIMISVKNQKLLRSSFQLVTSLGVSGSLIPGLGISLSRRCSTSAVLPDLNLTDVQKYEILSDCTDFFTRSYTIPVLKNIIITLHLCDYIASLIQLSFAPLKKPGTYDNFVMTEEMFIKLNTDKQKYSRIYEELVTTCFQPSLMKELLVLQSVTNPSPPGFVKRIISTEMSRRLLAPGGLLSLIRCFIESYTVDIGYDWKKVDMICKIITSKHGNVTINDYLKNICGQLVQILTLNNTYYLATAMACVLSLFESYKEEDPVNLLIQDIFNSFDYNIVLSKSKLTGTVVLTPQEIEHKINILHACLNTKINCPFHLLKSNVYMLFLIGMKCERNEEMKTKIKELLLKSLGHCTKDEVSDMMKIFLFGKEKDASHCEFIIEEYDAGVIIKSAASQSDKESENRLNYFINLFQCTDDEILVQHVFEMSLKILMDISILRQKKANKDLLLLEDETSITINKIDEQYSLILQLLSEISASSKVTTALKREPLIILEFVENLIKNYTCEEECATIALILLNTILSNSNKDLGNKLYDLQPILERISAEDSLNNILAKEALSLINSGKFEKQKESKYERALDNVFDNLLPVRAHGIIELTKLIDAGDAETISKKHYVFCLFQEQLKDCDSYVYLAAINGLASLCTYCTEDVLHILCKEFLSTSLSEKQVSTQNEEIHAAELRMKIGDVIVQVTRRLGEMAIVHKTTLLNTILCGCRDEDPLIRTSALSNLAEIARVLHYRMGSIIYEVLLCIWGVIETDKAVECRRAAVMVITNLIKGLGKETLIELKENLLPIYRTLKDIYSDDTEDQVVRLHAQLALEELNDVVNQFLFPELKNEKQIFVMNGQD